MTILVEDVNDNTPIFQRPHYEARVEENAASATNVLQVLATDLDGGANAQIRLVQKTSIMSEILALEFIVGQ